MTLRINELYTFFVVARARAMHSAAAEFGVTPGAISQRIRSVEERLGRRLFHRSRHGLTLTKTGEALWSDLGPAFAAIETANRRHFQPHPDTHIRISAVASFASSYLVPRLGEFTLAHRHVRVSIETDQRLVDLRGEPVDLAIRHGLGDYGGLKSEWIGAPELVVLASPALLRRTDPIKEPKDCLAFPLLQDAAGADWPLWFDAHGVDTTAAIYGPAFGDDFLIIRAAVEGQGLALVSDVYAADELRKGLLVRALDTTWPTRFAYYAVGLPATFERPAIRAFTQWLRAIWNDGEPSAGPGPDR